MTNKSDDEILIDCLIDTLAVLEEQETALRKLRVLLEPVLNGLYDTWQEKLAQQ